MASKGLSLLLWVFLVHLAGIYLYTRGFLLTRLSLSDTTACQDGSCTVPPSHKRAVVLVIDALRFDFLSPHPPEPVSPYHHNVLVLPQELTAVQPTRSLLFEMFSDPPTTTLQRLKGITTGSLPTFIDMGSNFGGSSITEDSFIGQLRAAGKKVSLIPYQTTAFSCMLFWGMPHLFLLSFPTFRRFFLACYVLALSKAWSCFPPFRRV